MKPIRLQTFLRIGLFCLFLFIILRLIDIRLLQDAIRNVQFVPLIAAGCIYIICVAIRAYRWQIIFNTNEHHHRLSFTDACIMTLVGIALNMFIPATMGDLAKSYYGYKRYGIKEEMLSTAVIDKLFAFCSIFLLGAVSGYVMGYTLLSIISLVSSLLALIPLLFPHMVPWKIVNRILHLFKKSLDTPKLLHAFSVSLLMKGYLLGISIGGWLLTCIYLYTLCRAFPVTVNLRYILLIMPLLTVIRLFPFTINALGPNEVAFAYFFKLIGIHPTLSVLISLSSNLVSSVIPGMIGFLMIFTMQKRDAHDQIQNQ